MTTNQIHNRMIDCTALAELLATEITHGRHVHPDDRNKPDLGGVAGLLARELAVLRDRLEALL